MRGSSWAVACGIAAMALAGCHRARLDAVGPRTVTNQTAFPIALYGEGFEAGQMLKLEGPVSREVPIAVEDARHAYARLPADLTLPAGVTQAQVKLSIKGGKGDPVAITVVNDLGFPDLIGLALTASGRAVAISQTTDQLFVIGPGRNVREVPTGDGPSAVASFREGDEGYVAVAHRFSPALWIWKDDFASPPRVLPAPSGASALWIDGATKTAYLAEQVGDSVEAISLEDGRVRWRTKVAPNPEVLVADGTRLAVGSAQAGVVQRIDLTSGKRLDTIQPGTDVEIDGGRTAAFSRYVIGGKAVRALASFEGALFVASIGPNVGPNPQRMEVSLNPGVGVIEGDRFVRHLGFGEGLTEALAIDPTDGVLFVADEGLGKVRAIDARALLASTVHPTVHPERRREAAESKGQKSPDLVTAKNRSGHQRSSDPSTPDHRSYAQGERGANSPARNPGGQLAELALPPPADFPRLRPDSALGGKLAGPEVYSGPRALALDAVAHRLYVLDRFTGTLAVIDISHAREGVLHLIDQIPIVDTRAEKERRLGQVLYNGDFGRTGITCEGCHLEGHTEGVFFAKTRPLRIYRAPSLRGAKDTPPYFTPASTHSLAETSEMVGNRNRFHRLPMSREEINALTVYSAAITFLPNPFLGADGAPPRSLGLPWGGEGNPGHGRKLFDAQGCARCHPAPLFTTDQDGATRGRFLDVGTPRGLAIHPEWQDLSIRGFGVPSLNGVWDVFPMLTSGAAGFEVVKGQLAISPVPPLIGVLEHQPAPHDLRALTQPERNDLYAYLLSR